MSRLVTIETAIVLVIVGAAIQLAAVVWFAPATFMLMVGIGAPLTLGGVVLYLVFVWRDLKEKGVL